MSEQPRPEFIDIGANLAHGSFRGDLGAVLARARAAGVVQMIVTGADLEGSEAAIRLAETDPVTLSATAGCHPHLAATLDSAAAVAAIASLAASPAVVAVGECGLDYHRDLSPRPAQRAAFEAQLQIAAQLGKPLFLHQRDAHDDFVAIMRAHRDAVPRAVAHCFTAGRDELYAYLDLDLHIGITGWICDERRGTHRIPAGRLMIETDAPYLQPRDLAPKPATRRNEPSYLPHIAARIAASRGETVEALAAHTTKAARQFFGLSQAPP